MMRKSQSEDPEEEHPWRGNSQCKGLEVEQGRHTREAREGEGEHQWAGTWRDAGGEGGVGDVAGGTACRPGMGVDFHSQDYAGTLEAFAHRCDVI